MKKMTFADFIKKTGELLHAYGGLLDECKQITNYGKY